jgi:hypothetical protein
MTTLYLVLRAIPSPENPYFNEVEGALVSCWVCNEDPVSAVAMSSFKVRQLNWEIVRLEESPINVTEEHYVDKEIAMERYRAAQAQGISIAFAAWSKDGKTSAGPIALKKSEDFILSEYLSKIGALKRKGRCLHFDAGTRCTESIDAHSIQRNGALSLIAQSGTVYVPSKNFGDTKRSKGRVAFAKQGISTVSTFRGFCGKHDNELFAPIDDFAFVPSTEQATLYAYRSLCREVFFKENSVALFRDLLNGPSNNKANKGVFDAMLKGSTFALKNLTTQKEKYDLMLKSKSFDRMKSVLFHSLQAPAVVFSGLLYPDYDFFGNRLQDLTDQSAEVGLISFSFVPMSQGWGLLFAWHSDSSASCVPLLRSLATEVHDGGDLGDLLFRFVVSNCENLAMSPAWWESLSENQQAEIANSANHGADVFSPLRSDYLTKGLENISGWDFDYVISEFE